MLVAVLLAGGRIKLEWMQKQATNATYAADHGQDRCLLKGRHYQTFVAKFMKILFLLLLQLGFDLSSCLL